jgi:hypothetical protein
MDPPWYPDFMQQFAWVASRSCRVGGHVISCFPPDGTRPGIQEERSAFEEWARYLGLTLLLEERCVLHYCTPPFERNALAACGITNVPGNWRRANLLVYRREKLLDVPRPPLPVIGPTWEEASLNGVRIRVRHDDTPSVCFTDPTLVKLVDGNVLPSVSRRNPIRGKADVWTSGNRIFGCRGRGLITGILKALAARASPLYAVSSALNRVLSAREQELVEQTTEAIHALVKEESYETWKYYEG